MKPFLMIVGLLAAILIVSQLVMGLLILQGQTSMRTAHQHSGYLTVAVTLIYIFWSLAVIASSAKRDALPEIAIDRARLRRPRSPDPRSETSVDRQDRLDDPVAIESTHEEPRCRLMAKECAERGLGEAPIDDIGLVSSPTHAHGERAIGGNVSRFFRDGKDPPVDVFAVAPRVPGNQERQPAAPARRCLVQDEDVVRRRQKAPRSVG